MSGWEYHPGLLRRLGTFGGPSYLDNQYMDVNVEPYFVPAAMGQAGSPLGLALPRPLSWYG